MNKDLKNLFYALSFITGAGLLLFYPHIITRLLIAGYFIFKATPKTIELFSKYWKRKVFKKYNS